MTTMRELPGWEKARRRIAVILAAVLAVVWWIGGAGAVGAVVALSAVELLVMAARAR